LIQEKPIIRFHIECYHYYSTYHTDSNGNYQTKVHKQITYTETRDFEYEEVEYFGSEFQKKEQIKPYLDLALYKIYECGNDETLRELNNERRKIEDDNRDRDTYISFKEEFIINGFVNTIYSKKKEVREPKCFSLSFYIFYTLILLSFCYRRYVQLFLDHQEFTLKYRIFLKKKINKSLSELSDISETKLSKLDEFNGSKNNFVYQNYDLMNMDLTESASIENDMFIKKDFENVHDDNNLIYYSKSDELPNIKLDKN
jgi:hypothetical protein